MPLPSRLGVISLLFLTACQSAPETSFTHDARAFPADWVGKWRGPCQLLRGEGAPRDFVMTLEIGQDKGGRRPWQITYGEGAQTQVRDYTLVMVKPGAGHYAIDENNGIVLDAFLRGGALFSSFEVQGTRLLSRYECRGDTLSVEIVTTGIDVERENRDSTPVDTFAVRTVQRGLLRRVDGNGRVPRG